MKSLIKTKQAKAIAVAIALLGLSTSSKAQLSPVTTSDSPVTLTSPTSFTLQGAPIATETVNIISPLAALANPITDPLGIIGMVSEQVYNDNSFIAGKTTLDFVYTISLNSFAGTNGTEGIFSFAPNFATNVGYLSTGGIAPVSADRTALNELSFTFPTGQLAPGATSDELIVQTDSLGYDANGAMGFSGSGTALGLYEPNALLAPAPEPTSALFGAALLGGVLVSRRRQNKARSLELAAI